MYVRIAITEPAQTLYMSKHSLQVNLYMQFCCQQKSACAHVLATPALVPHWLNLIRKDA